MNSSRRKSPADTVAVSTAETAASGAPAPVEVSVSSASAEVATPSAQVHLGRNNRLGTQSVGKLLLEFSVPAIIMMMFNSLYNIIDAAFLGNAVGQNGIAVTTLVLPVMMLLIAFSSWAGQGGCALAAIQLGKGEQETAERTLGNATVLLIVLAGLVALFGMIFMDQLLALVGTTPDLMEPTRLFLSIIFFGFIFQSLGMGLNDFLRTAGKPNLALAASVSGTASCIAFNYLFVMVLHWGIAGSAYATIFGEFIGMVPVLWYFIFSKTAVFNLRLRAMKPDFHLQGQILMLGLASFLMQAASTVVGIIMNQMLVTYGAMTSIGADGALSGVGVVGKLGWFITTPIVGIAMGAQPLIGFNYGARQWHRVIKGFGLMALWSTIVAVICWAFIQLFPGPVVSLFGVTGELKDYTVEMLKIYTIIFSFVGFQISGSSYFQSSGQPIKSAILELTRQVIFLIPLYYIMPPLVPQLFPQFSGLDAVVMATPVSDALSVLVTAVFVIVEIRRLRAAARTQTDFSDRPLLGEEYHAHDSLALGDKPAPAAQSAPAAQVTAAVPAAQVESSAQTTQKGNDR